MANRRSAPKPLFDTLDNVINQAPPKILDFPFTKRDFLATVIFLEQYKSNKATFEAYRRELERLMQWAWHIAKKPVLKLSRPDIEDYLTFCQRPPKSWIGTKRVARFITKNGERVPNPDWHIFVVTRPNKTLRRGKKPDIEKFKISNEAMGALFTALSSFYNYLLCENFVKVNPMAQIRQKNKYLKKQQGKRKVRRLTELQWDFVIEAAEDMANENPIRHERTLFIMTALYLMYLRISELVATERWEPQMGHFYQDSQGRWWFKTVGKGNKERDITVSDAMLKALKRYRRSRQLSPTLPLSSDQTPLIYALRGNKAISNDRQIRVVVQECFDKAIRNLRDEGFKDEAKMLQEATVHWLRHTGISDDINKRGRPIAHVRDDAGHSSSAITDRYNDIELEERHASAKKKDVR